MTMRCPKCSREDVAAYAEQRPCAACREKQSFRRKVNRAMRECGRNHAAADRVIAWMRDPERKPANIQFTAGSERQIAYAFEDAMRRKK